MNWTDDAILLSVAKVAKTALLMDALTRDHGRCQAVITLKGAKLPTLLPGSFLRLAFSPGGAGKHGAGKLLDVSGGLFAESAESVELAVIQAIKDMSLAFMPAHEPLPDIYQATEGLLNSLLCEDRRWPLHFVRWEFTLLTALGHVEGAARCSSDFRHGEAIYISPRSGRMATRTEAGAFLDRMLPVPSFLLGARNATIVEVLQGNDLSQALFERFLMPEAEVEQLPASRAYLIERMRMIRTIPATKADRQPVIDEEARRVRMRSARPLMVSNKVSPH